jgi:GH43 family beta-xylosidase
MSDPVTISGTRVRLSSPTADWERGTELDLQEGPTFLRNGDNVFLIYSTRESWLPDYRLGQLRLASAAADPLQPANWTKTGPVFAAAADAFGVGHASFTTSPDGTEPWIVYHAKVSASPGWDRAIRMQEFTWNPDGSPNFGTPAARTQRLPMPSGQCAH